jgi:ABC-type glutathione transport system ATPase component
MSELLRVEGLSVEFGPKARPIRVVDDVSFAIPAPASRSRRCRS